MTIWNPWRGCKRFSDGCKYCYIHKGDLRRNINTNEVVKTDKFNLPIRKNVKDEYVVNKPNTTVYTCFTSDFLIEEADSWRTSCWSMIKEKSDLKFLFLTKRIH